MQRPAAKPADLQCPLRVARLPLHGTCHIHAAPPAVLRARPSGLVPADVNHRYATPSQCSETILLDLKYLLREAKQRVPHFLLALDDPLEKQVGRRSVCFGGVYMQRTSLRGSAGPPIDTEPWAPTS